MVTVAVLAACDSPDPSRDHHAVLDNRPAAHDPARLAAAVPGPAPADDGGAASPGAAVNPDEPIAAGQLTRRPCGPRPDVRHR